MLILTIRTDKPEAELGLYDDQTKLNYFAWTAHRQLAEMLHGKITELLNANGKQLSDVEAIGCYAGPGSFTGLRIGLTVANTLAYALEVPIVGAEGEDWLPAVLERVVNGESDDVVQPAYGADVHITLPRTAR